MGMTDPIADLLTRIRNASRARHQKVTVPYSHLKENIVKVLIDEGYLKDQKKVKAAIGGGDEMIIHTEVRPGKPAHHSRHEAGQQARPACLCRLSRSAADPQRIGYPCALDAQGDLGRS